MNKLAILGASGHGKVVAAIAELLGYEVSFFDDAYPQKMFLESWSIVGTTNDLLSALKEFKQIHVAIGINAIRKEKLLLFSKQGVELPKLIHPSATVSNYASLGDGVAVMAGAVINPFATVASGCIVNTGAVIEHDCVIEACSHISPNATLCGGASLGECSWLGAGSVVKQLVVIGCDCVIGAGSSVVHNVVSGVTVAGCPAKPLK